MKNTSLLDEHQGAGGAGAAKLAATVAHELNNPLDAVLRFVSLAQRKVKLGDYADIERYLNDAQFGLERMTEILRELMDIGRETHALMQRPERVPLVDLIGVAVRTVAAHAEEKNVTLAVKNLLGAGMVPRCDGRLSQVLANLLKNAVEASPAEEVVRVTIHAEGAGLIIAVEDAGEGLPENLLLFTPFVTTKAEEGGHGLGLAISRELVEAIGGTLTLANRMAPLRGCLATVVLPMDDGNGHK